MDSPKLFELSSEKHLPMAAMKIRYLANNLVAGWIGKASLFFPKTATVFSNAYENTEVMRLVGCFWLAIAVLAILGFGKPRAFSPVFLVHF
jgi:hypothetical protein